MSWFVFKVLKRPEFIMLGLWSNTGSIRSTLEHISFVIKQVLSLQDVHENIICLPYYMGKVRFLRVFIVDKRGAFFVLWECLNTLIKDTP